MPHVHQQLHIKFLGKFVDMCNYKQVSASNHEKEDSLQVIEISNLRNVICVIDLQNLTTCIDEIYDVFECSIAYVGHFNHSMGCVVVVTG